MKTNLSSVRIPRKINENGILSKRSKSEKVLYAIVFVIFLIQSVSLVYPVIWMFISSLKTAYEYNIVRDHFGLPEVWQFQNYAAAFQKLETYDGTNFFGMLLNSLWIVGLSTFLSVVGPLVTGYTMSKYRFRGRTFIYTVAVTAMVIPIIGTSAANMKFIRSIGFYDNPLYIIWSCSGGFGTNFLVYYGFFKSVSWSYAEAAQIDGAGHFRIFFKIMLPQAVPIMMTYAITNAIMYWNAYESVLLYMPSHWTLATGLYDYGLRVKERSGNYPVYFAGLIISMIPTLILFASCSQKIMTSISIGGLKG